MKTKDLFQILIVAVLILTLPISQAYAVVPDLHSVLSEVAEEAGVEVSEEGVEQSEEMATHVPTGDLIKPATIIPTDILAEEPPALEAVELDNTQEMDLLPLQPDKEHHFWTKKKILLSTALLLALLLLIGAASGAASGDGGIFGIFGGGNDPKPGFPDPTGAPHNPEPSTFLLMGLGLLVPFLRKRWS